MVAHDRSKTTPGSSDEHLPAGVWVRIGPSAPFRSSDRTPERLSSRPHQFGHGYRHYWKRFQTPHLNYDSATTTTASIAVRRAGIARASTTATRHGRTTRTRGAIHPRPGEAPATLLHPVRRGSHGAVPGREAPTANRLLDGGLQFLGIHLARAITHITRPQPPTTPMVGNRRPPIDTRTQTAGVTVSRKRGRGSSPGECLPGPRSGPGWLNHSLDVPRRGQPTGPSKSFAEPFR